jgi:hypothetical protein
VSLANILTDKLEPDADGKTTVRFDQLSENSCHVPLIHEPLLFVFIELRNILSCVSSFHLAPRNMGVPVFTAVLFVTLLKTFEKVGGNAG